MSKELNDAVDKAMENTEVNDADEKPSEPSAKASNEDDSDDSEVESKEETEDKTDGLTAAQLAHAKTLYKQLSDPKTAVETITQMVKRAGYTLTELKEADKQERKEITADVVEIFKEELGEDFDLVAGDKLSKAVAKLLDAKVAAALKPLETKLLEAEYSQRRKEVDKALEWAYDTLEGFKQNESLIAEKMQTYPYAGKGSYQSYLTEMHALVTSGAAQKRTQRAETNLKNDVKASKSVRSSATKPTKAMSLDEAIEMALSEIKS